MDEKDVFALLEAHKQNANETLEKMSAIADAFSKVVELVDKKSARIIGEMIANFLSMS